jgi:hypothetical protein
MDLTPDPKAAQLLRDALNLMNDGGRHWIKGGSRRGESYCSLGAIRVVVFGGTSVTEGSGPRFNRYVRMVQALARAAGKTPESPSPGIGTSVVEWNDAEDRTFPEVRAGFEAAIAKLGG